MYVYVICNNMLSSHKESEKDRQKESERGSTREIIQRCRDKDMSKGMREALGEKNTLPFSYFNKSAFSLT